MTTLKEMCKKAGFKSVNEFVELSGKDRTRIHRLFKNMPIKFEALFIEVSNHKANRAKKAVISGMNEAIKDYVGDVENV